MYYKSVCVSVANVHVITQEAFSLSCVVCIVLLYLVTVWLGLNLVGCHC